MEKEEYFDLLPYAVFKSDREMIDMIFQNVEVSNSEKIDALK